MLFVHATVQFAGPSASSTINRHWNSTNILIRFFNSFQSWIAANSAGRQHQQFSFEGNTEEIQNRSIWIKKQIFIAKTNGPVCSHAFVYYLYLSRHLTTFGQVHLQINQLTSMALAETPPRTNHKLFHMICRKIIKETVAQTTDLAEVTDFLIVQGRWKNERRNKSHKKGNFSKLYYHTLCKECIIFSG